MADLSPNVIFIVVKKTECGIGNNSCDAGVFKENAKYKISLVEDNLKTSFMMMMMLQNK